MENDLTKKDILLFAKNAINNIKFSNASEFTLLSDDETMNIEVTEECTQNIFLRKNIEFNEVQINPKIASTLDKQALHFFIVWGFLAKKENSCLQTDIETYELLNNESREWLYDKFNFINGFHYALSGNITSENIERFKNMVNRISIINTDN